MHPAHFACWVLKSNNIALAHSIYPRSFWPEERPLLNVKFRVGLFSDKKWLQLIWVSNSEFIVFFIFSKNWTFLKMFCKNLCDKVSKFKNLRWPFFSFFHALCRGVLCFFCRSIFHGENCEIKLAVLTEKSSFFYFFKKLKISEIFLQKSLWQSFEN